MFCVKCGTQIKNGYKFCPKCGTPAYVELEKSQNEIEVHLEDAKVNAEKEAIAKTNEGTEKTSEPKTVSSSKETKASPSTNNVFIPNPFMAKELDIEGIKKRAEEGDRYAMSLQCYRYEMGIGTKIDMEKHNELKKILGGVTYGIVGRISLFYYSKELANPYILTKNQ